MIIKGGPRGRGQQLATHLLRTDTNEKVAMLEMEGVLSRDLHGALAEMEAVAAGKVDVDATDAAALNLDQQRNAAPAKPQPENLNCPPGFNLPKGEADVRGISAGANLDQAILFVKCQNKGVTYQLSDTGRTYGDGSPGARQLVRLTDGTPYGNNLAGMNAAAMARREYQGSYTNIHQDYYFATTGAKGAEIVRGVSYMETFEDGKNPTVDDSAKALIAKYGQPSGITASSPNVTDVYEDLTWVYDAGGQKLAKPAPGLYADDAPYSKCVFNGVLEGPRVLDSHCGLTIQARIVKLPKNELLAKTISYGFINQAQMMAALETQHQADVANDDTRKQSEARAASGNAPKF